MRKNILLQLLMCIIFSIWFSLTSSFNRSNDNPQNLTINQRTIQFLSSILNKFQPKLPISNNIDSLVVASLPTEQQVEKHFSFNPNRSIRISTKKDVSSFWQEISGASDEIRDITSKLLAAKVPATIKSGTTASVKFDTDGSVLSASWRIDEKSLVQVDRYLGNTFSVKKVADTQETKERVVSGTIISNFVDAAQNAGLPYALIDDYIDMFSDRIDFRRDLQPGDTFSIVLDEKQGSDGHWLSTGAIKAACLYNSGKLKAIVRYMGKDGKWVNFDEQAHPIGSYFLRYPLQFTRISSVFTDSRMHPILGFARPHNGVDFAAPTGTPVRSVADGVVVASGYFGESGNMIKIAHNSRYSTAYLHLSKINSGIRKGAHIARGQIIGAVGMTGLATGPHLHFSLYDNGKYTDPLKAKLPSIISDIVPPQFIKASLTRLQDELHKVVVAKNFKDNSKQG